MLQAGSKNWIKKYIELSSNKEIDLAIHQPGDMSKEAYLHTTLFRSGIVFGYPSHLLFCPEEFRKDWTTDEQLKILLFESLYLVYKVERNEPLDDQFVFSLQDFYEKYRDNSSLNVFKLLFKETKHIQVENILHRRVHVKKTLKNQFWVNYLNNSLVFLDVLAFREYLVNDKKLEDSYEDFLMATLQTVASASLVDGIINSSEQTLIDIFISSANIDESKIKGFKKRLKENDVSIKDINVPDNDDLLYKLFLIDMAVLTVHSDLSALDSELVFLFQLCKYLGVETDQLHKAVILIERFVIENNHKVNFLAEQSSYEQLYTNFSRRWIKVLGRNKGKLIEELKESKELIALVNKSLNQELTVDEKEKVKQQFSDIVKSMPAIAIFMLPGGLLILPIILKIIPNLIPSAFKGNETNASNKEGN
jgi:hypothetical protein